MEQLAKLVYVMDMGLYVNDIYPVSCPFRIGSDLIQISSSAYCINGAGLRMVN
ncbi:hypothetical protein G4Z05_12810 [Bacillus thermocopriae]|uniref:Uncharacterized protein n=1 Tax=Neobacillus thermocopriae TaxID=1215031 RepID=A0A6B3TVR0_9BACI|nr:hypothetical protein [Neobacillus thermocopriae]MED3623154.1 hypothetical protein [Neobacillus thermocopriae]MED3715049.1 hypothetical protein [Neobacillus thermocopriae]NEX79737.1 hypothetical protein [Neobacillus thermocopriae]